MTKFGYDLELRKGDLNIMGKNPVDKIVSNINEISELIALSGKEIGEGMKECFTVLQDSEFYKTEKAITILGSNFCIGQLEDLKYINENCQGANTPDEVCVNCWKEALLNHKS